MEGMERRRGDDDALTRGEIVPILEDIKDLIKSTMKNLEETLIKEMDEKFKVTWAMMAEWKNISH
jgi:hypothetical protein